MLRHNAQKEEFIVSTRMNERFRQAVSMAEAGKSVRRVTARMAALVILVLLLLAGFAIAASTWGVLDFFAANDPEPNTYLAEKVQPVGSAHQGDGYTIEVTDVLCDRGNLAIAWSLTNGREDTLYILCDVQDADGNIALENNRGYHNAQTALLAPHEQFDAVYYAQLDELIPTDRLNLSLAFTVLSHDGEIIVGDAYFTSDHDWDFAWSDEEKAKQRELIMALDQAKWAEYDALRREHTDIPFYTGGVIALPYGYEETGAYTKDLIESGLFTWVDAWALTIPVKVDTQAVSALPDGKPLEIELAAYTLRFTRADLLGTSIFLEFECIADTLPLQEDDAPPPPIFEAFASDLNAWQQSVLQDPSERQTNDLQWSCSSNGFEKREDGKWVSEQSYRITALTKRPDTLLIIPRAFLGYNYGYGYEPSTDIENVAVLTFPHSDGH